MAKQLVKRMLVLLAATALLVSCVPAPSPRKPADPKPFAVGQNWLMRWRFPNDVRENVVVFEVLSIEPRSNSSYLYISIMTNQKELPVVSRAAYILYNHPQAMTYLIFVEKNRSGQKLTCGFYDFGPDKKQTNGVSYLWKSSDPDADLNPVFYFSLIRKQPQPNTGECSIELQS